MYCRKSRQYGRQSSVFVQEKERVLTVTLVTSPGVVITEISTSRESESK